MNIINENISPQSDLEKMIVSDEEFIMGSMWGKPRNGHPEGLVIYHIKEVLDNIEKDKNNISIADYTMLRLIAIVHDTFKYKVDTTKPKSGENHHAMYARRFMEKYTDDRLTLDIIELHDEAYNSWQVLNRRGDHVSAEKRINRLFDRFYNIFEIELYTKFYLYDGMTGDKKNDDYKWYIEQLSKYKGK